MEKEKQTINLGTDHAGFELKEALKEFLTSEGWKVIDHGALGYDAEDDYPELIARAARAASEDPTHHIAIVLGGSGTGEAIVANRFPHVRTMVYNGGPRETIGLSREHNDANCLSLGARFLDIETAKSVVKEWLDTPFSNGERHVRRIAQIEEVR
jgi:ribose 5-phosphate isomerase B